MPGTKKMGMYKKHKTAKGMPKKKGMTKKIKNGTCMNTI